MMQPRGPETAMTMMRVLLSSAAAILLSREGGMEKPGVQNGEGNQTWPLARGGGGLLNK